MKTIRNIFAILIILLLTSSCHHSGNTIIVNNGKDKLEINYTGEVKFTDDEAAIKSMTKNSYLKYWKNDRKLRVKCNIDGELTYEMFDNGRKLNPEDAEGKKFLAEAIQGMISVGFDAQGRMKRIVEKGGLRALLSEVDRLDNDFIKSMYLEYLISSDSIHPDQITDIAKKIGTQIGSDFEKSKLLQKFSAIQLKDSLTSKAYFEAAVSVGSDFEKANVLKHIIRQPLSKEQFDAALNVTNTVGSDFEKANILKELLHQETVAGENLNLFLSSVDHIGSDFEKANILNELIDKKPFEGKNFTDLLSSINRVGSDFEKTNLLKKLANKEFQTEEQWIGLIAETAKIDSEFERGNVLVQIAGKMPKSEEVKTSYMNVAKTINSEVDYGKVVKAVD
ncbi:hypothetical protein [Aquipluma nitroreducens]|nr:hypothetical protein [Aquipluma nitroreducens]